MARENVVNLGREFSVTVESFRNSSGEEVMRWDFKANVEDPHKRTNLIIAMWNALEEAFRNSGFMRLEQRSGEIHRICEFGRSQARSCTESRLNWEFILFENAPANPGVSADSFFGQFDLDALIPYGTGYQSGFITKPLDSGSDSRTAAKLRIFNDFKRHLKQALQMHVVNNNELRG